MNEQTPLELAAQVLAPLEVDNYQTRAVKVLEAVEAAPVLARAVQEQQNALQAKSLVETSFLDMAKRVEGQQAEIERLRAAIEWLESNRIHMQNYDVEGVLLWWNSTPGKAQMVHGSTILEAIQKAQSKQGQEGGEG